MSVLEQIPIITDVRFHGRGGQGVVTASRLLAEAAVLDGKYVHGFPTFGPERAGAPIAAFTRICEKRFTVKTEVYEPDLIVCQDPTLLGPSILGGAKKTTIVIVTFPGDPEELKKKLNTDLEVHFLDAIGIGKEVIGRPLANTVMLGALLKVTNIVPLEELLKAVDRVFKGQIAEKNKAAVKKAYDQVKKLE